MLKQVHLLLIYELVLGMYQRRKVVQALLHTQTHIHNSRVMDERVVSRTCCVIPGITQQLLFFLHRGCHCCIFFLFSIPSEEVSRGQQHFPGDP